MSKTLLVAVAFFAASAWGADPKTIAYGKYLVEEVAKCQMCHSPKLETGEYDKEKWLKGAVLDFQPLQPVKGWHKTSPDLTQTSKLWSKWGEATVMKYLQTGLNPKGVPADPPMPAYKFNAKDADAILEYLKSLK